MHEITFIIHTFMRPECLERLLDSIQRYYPDTEVLIYDDTDWDLGLSYGRNHLVSLVKTPFFLLLDDDFIFTHNTKIELMKDKIGEDYDIIAGSLLEDGVVRHFEGRYDLQGGHLRYILSQEEPLHFVFNFFLGRTETFKKYKWDYELKLAEHTDFFLTHHQNLKIGYLEEVQIEHKSTREGEYKKMRLRAYKYMDKFMEKYGLTVIDYYGGEGKYELGDYLKEKYNV